MKVHTVFQETSITNIEPEGWLRSYLETQVLGLTGNMEAAGYPFNTKGWGTLNKIEGREWWPYEQTGYWVDGAIRCAHLLRDSALLKKAATPVEFTIANPDEDGFLGPRHLKEQATWNQWSHSVFFRAAQAHFQATGNKIIPKRICNHYLSGVDFSDGRDICNVESMLWAYEKTGNKRLLDLAKKSYSEFNKKYEDSDMSVKTMLSDEKPSIHGVTFNEIAKLGALMYKFTGNKKYLDATINAYKKLDRFSMLIDGIHSSSEHIHGKEPLDSHETCDIADYTWSVGHLLMVTGLAEYADKIERACFNAAPGAVTPDFKGLQYFSCPNQVVASSTSNHNAFFRGHKWMSYRPNPGTECCPGEVNRIMPNYAARMWMEDGKGGIVAALYGPSRFTTKIGKVNVTIVEDTCYPFSEEIAFRIRCDKPVRFSFHLRIPGWCKNASIAINGENAVKSKLKRDSFIKLDRTFNHNDLILLRLPMDIKLSNWPKGGIGVERGPLVFALAIDEKLELDKNEKRQTKDFPAYNRYPASDWNYALCLNSKTFAKDVEVVFCQPSYSPWTPESTPIRLVVPAQKIMGWNVIKAKQIESQYWAEENADGCSVLVFKKQKGNFILTPDLPESKFIKNRVSKKVEKITLVPYGCTQLRIAIFPRVI